MNRVVFPVKPLADDVVRVFDFTSLLTEGEELAAATVDVSVYAGTDATPSALLNGSAVIDGPRVEQAFTGGTLGTVYTVTCLAGSCDGQLQSLAAYLAVVEQAEE